VYARLGEPLSMEQNAAVHKAYSGKVESHLVSPTKHSENNAQP